MDALSAKARAALDAICDTFVPGGDGLPSATELGVPDALLGRSAATRARPSASRSRSCSGCGTRAADARSAAAVRRFTVALAGRARGGAAVVGRQPRGRSARRLPGAAQGRAARATTAAAGPDGGPNPVWDALGYPGPLGPPENPPPQHARAARHRRATPSSTATSWSSARAPAAAPRRGCWPQAGLDVVVRRGRRLLQRGRLRRRRAVAASRGSTSTAAAWPPHDRASGCWPARASAAARSSTTRGRFRPPDYVREEWAAHRAVRLAPRQDFDDSLDAVWERIGDQPEHSVPSSRDQAMRAGLDELGWHSDVDAAQRASGCTRGGLPALPLRLPARRQAVDDEDLAPGRRRQPARGSSSNAPVDRVMIEGGAATRCRGAHRSTATA